MSEGKKQEEEEVEEDFIRQSRGRGRGRGRRGRGADRRRGDPDNSAVLTPEEGCEFYFILFICVFTFIL